MSDVTSVLIIDDNQRVGQLLSLSLMATGVPEISVEQNPRNAMERIRETNPDIIILDVHMPEMDGIALLYEIRRKRPCLPVIMCSSMIRPGDVESAYALGCHGFLPKPTSLEGYRTLAQTILGYWSANVAPEPLHASLSYSSAAE